MSEDNGRNEEERKEKTRDRMDRYSSDTSETADTTETAEATDTGDKEESEDEEQTEDTSETTDVSNTKVTSATSDTSDTAERFKWTGKPGLRDRKDMNMYLPDELHNELMAVFAELNAQYTRKHGEDLEKHKQFIPLLIETALEEDVDELREKLDLTS